MQLNTPSGVREFAIRVVVIAVSLSLPGSVVAKKEAKTYAEEGKIVATGLTEWVINSKHQYAHTYTVVTNAKSYVLECSHKPVFGTVGEECGGSRKLQIGDVIHFRIENDRVYIPITKIDNSGGEEKLRILSTTLRPDSESDKSRQAVPESKEAKPPMEKTGRCAVGSLLQS